jgi:hypothetical protein
MTGGGFLAIWSDIAAADETDYVHWLTREHVAERLGIPGFLSARVFRTRITEPRYLILYSLTDQRVLSSAAYIDRLNNPSAWTRRIMPILSNFKRGGGTVKFRDGWGCGGIVAPLVDPELVNHDMMGTLAACDRIAAVSLLESDCAATNIATNEKSLRSADMTFERILLVEATSTKALIECFASAKLSPDGAKDCELYEAVFSAS